MNILKTHLSRSFQHASRRTGPVFVFFFLAAGRVPPMSYGDAASSAGAPRMPRKGFKLVLLGDASVGKSSILMRFLHNKFSEEIATRPECGFAWL